MRFFELRVGTPEQDDARAGVQHGVVDRVGAQGVALTATGSPAIEDFLSVGLHEVGLRPRVSRVEDAGVAVRARTGALSDALLLHAKPLRHGLSRSQRTIWPGRRSRYSRPHA